MSELTVKDLNDYTLEELLNVSDMEWDEIRNDFDSLILVPTEQVHDSGFRCMEFIGCIGNRPIAKMSGCSDVIHIGGIGGYDKFPIGSRILPVGWSIDCLNKTGLMRLFVDQPHKIENGSSTSSFNIYSNKKTD